MRVAATVLGIVFLAGFLAKLVDPREIIGAVGLGLNVRPQTAWLIVHAVLAVELGLGVMLLLQVRLFETLLATSLLLLAFTAFLMTLLLRDAPVPCGCGIPMAGMPGTDENVAGVIRNLVLFGIAGSSAWVLVSQRSRLRLAG